jgi:serine/threonine protein kinase/regulation of enolase protein 1 (concanavalin A-like superfamily)
VEELGWLAHYRIRKLVGAGGMGLVYLADDTLLGRPVALKVIRPELSSSPESAARFTREARSAAAIHHDHVVTIYQVGEANGVAYLAMEYLQGISLQAWLDRGRKPSVDLILRIGREVASGLVAAHRLGLVHRDIKPANIWLEAPHGRVKILDFGQARADREDVGITQSGVIVGTPAFMSPEQAVGDRVAASSDLFSLGTVLYRLCCGQLPFEGKTILSTLSALASRTPTPPIEINPEIPEELSTLVFRLLAKDPADRPESAQSLHDALRAIERQLIAQRQAVELSSGNSPLRSQMLEISEEPTLIADPERDSPPERSWFRRRNLVLAGSVLLIGLVAFSVGHRQKTGNAGKDQVTSIDSRDEVSRTLAPTPTPNPSPSDETEPQPTPVPAHDSKPQDEDRVKVPGPISLDRVTTGAVADPVPSGMVKASSEIVQAAKKSEVEWGKLIDPSGDCRLVRDEEQHSSTLEIPGTPHVLSAELKRMNAPRTLREVSGDFQVRMRVSGTEHVAGRPTAKPFTPYHGAGLLLWQDQGNYVRLEIATDIHRGKPRSYANFEYRQDSQLIASKGQLSENGSANLRLDRQGDEVRASFSNDGKRWVTFPALKVRLSEDLKVGIVGINTASTPFTARFEDLIITKP